MNEPYTNTVSANALDRVPASAISQPKQDAGSLRLAFIDNIRWVMIVLVLSMHSADTYSPFGNWYYTEHPKLGLPSVVFFSVYQSFLQAFFMALLFFIAGYFTPRSYDKKGPGRYLYDRFIRLGLPTMLYMLVIGPLTEYYVSKSWRTPDSFAKAWWGHITDGEVFSMTGPMWFCAALLIFCAVYAGMRWLSGKAGLKPFQTPALSNRNVALLISLIAITTYVVEGLDASGKSFYNMHLPDFPSYILLFAAGILAYRGNWLARLEYRFGLRWCALALGIGCVLWIGLIVFGGALQGHFSAYGGGWHWQNLGMCFWAAIICVGVSLGLLVSFRDRFNAQGRFARFMSDNAFAVYVFHPPILIAIALGLRWFAVPGVFKFVLLTALSATACFIAAELVFRRIAILKRIL